MKGVRKLACAAAGFSGAIFAAHYILPTGWMYPLAAVFVLLSLSGLLLKGLWRQRVLIALLAASAGLAGYCLHYNNTVAAVEPLVGKKETVTFRLEDYPQQRSYGSTVYASLCEPNVPGVKTVIYDYSGALGELRPGTLLRAELSFKSAAERNGRSTDSLVSDGVYLCAVLNGEPELLPGDEGSPRYIPQRLGHALRQMISRVFPEDAAPFLIALLTGDKTEYYLDEELSALMSIAGLAHTVAVSGMHVSFLVAFIQLVFGKRRAVSVLSIAFIWLFVLMSGSSPSAVRAGFMVTVYLMAPIFRRENDRATTLFFALAVILAQNPFACASISLQLSFAAIAGIFLFTEPLYSWLDDRLPGSGRIKLYILSAFSNSVAVSVFSVPVIAAHFGYISLLSALTNVLCLWVISLLFIGGYTVCAVGFISASAAKALGAVLAYAVRYIALTVRAVARLPFAALYLGSTYSVLWLVLVYLSFAVTWLFRDREKAYSPVMPTVCSIIALLAVFLWNGRAVSRDDGTVAVLNAGSGQCIVMTERDSTVVVDCGSSGAPENIGSQAVSYLMGQGRQSIDCLVLTHLHTDHANGAVRLMTVLPVSSLILPENAGENAAEGLTEKILMSAQKNGVRVSFLSEDMLKDVGKIKLDLYAPISSGEMNERGLMLKAKVGDKSVLITGDASSATEKKLVARQELSDTDVLIVGHHGSRYSTSEELLSSARPSVAVISVGENGYGSPSGEVLHKLDYYGAEIYRTDLSGRIIINTGETDG